MRGKHAIITLALLGAMSCVQAKAPADSNPGTEASGVEASRTETSAVEASGTTLPASAQLADTNDSYSLYICPEGTSADGVEIKSVWLEDKKKHSVKKVCTTNPESPIMWDKMNRPGANGVEVPLSDVAAADNAQLWPGKGNKVIVEGCPDGRNVWSYIIDCDTHRAVQLPSQEGVVGFDADNNEVLAASYGYNEDGRYDFISVFSPEGKFIRKIATDD